MTDKIGDHAAEWKKLYWQAFKKHPSYLAETVAADIVKVHGWEALKRSIVYCGQKGFGWASVLKYFTKKEQKERQVEAQTTPRGQDVSVYEGIEYEQGRTPAGEAMVRRIKRSNQEEV
jgi:hypothetical protein